MPKFSGILPGFLTNQNFWGWTCTLCNPIFYTTEFAVHSYPLIYPQRQVAKLASGLFYCWSLLRNNNVFSNVQRLTSSYGSRWLGACVCWTQTFWQVMHRNSGCQTRNQLGIPGEAESFLRGTQMFQTLSNTFFLSNSFLFFLNYVKHIFPGGTKHFVGGFATLVTDLVTALVIAVRHVGLYCVKRSMSACVAIENKFEKSECMLAYVYGSFNKQKN